MKRILIILAIILILLAVPVVVLLSKLKLPPSDAWSNSVVVMEFEDDSLKKYAPIDVLEDGDNFVIVNYSDGRLLIERCDAMGVILEEWAIDFTVEGIWQLYGISIDNNRLDLAVYGEYTLTLVELDLDALKVASTQTFKGLRKFDVAKNALIYSDDENVTMVIEDLSINLGKADAKSLQIDREGDKVIAVVSKRVYAATVNTLYHYDLKTKSLESKILSEVDGLEYGKIKDIRLSEGTAGLLFANEMGLNRNRTICYTGILANGIDTSLQFQKQGSWLKSGAVIGDVNDDAMTLVMPAHTATGLEFVLWTTNKKFDPSQRITSANSLIASPKYFKNDEEVVMWIEVKTEGKRVHMASTREGFGIIGFNLMDLMTSITMVFASSVVVALATVIPYMLHFGAVISILYFTEKNFKPQWLTRFGTKLYGLFTAGYVTYLMLGIFVPSTAKMMFLPDFMRLSWFRFLLLATVIGLAWLITKLIVKLSDFEGKYTTMITYSLVLGFIYTISFNIYVPLEFGLKKLYFL